MEREISIYSLIENLKHALFQLKYLQLLLTDEAGKEINNNDISLIFSLPFY